MTLRFIGTKAEVGAQKLNRFGQAFTLPDAIAETLIEGKLPALPDSEFSAIGFTSRELELYQYPSTHADAPESFLKKKQAALTRLIELRSGAKSQSLMEA